jgi:HD-like signal output (HDOD) protein/ActR/RegA family two-component response regulator
MSSNPAVALTPAPTPPTAALRPALRRILFVDDEAQVLDGLRNLLRKQRQRWAMTFVGSGRAALEELARAPYDVVVSDMRMPGMDGAELLRETKRLYPTTTRIILSGHSEHEAVMRALPVAHQFLHKPCDPEQLRIVVDRACELQTLLGAPDLRSAIGAVLGRLDKLPSTSSSYQALTSALDDPHGTVGAIAAVIERDPAMSIKVLQLVNSSYFGLQQSMTSIKQAVNYLGLELIKTLAMTAQLFARIEAQPIAGFSLPDFQARAIRAARIARKLLTDPRRADEAFASALVHDIGEVLIALGAPEACLRIAAEVQARGVPRDQVERELLGVSHAELGAYLLGMWGLPLAIVEAVAFHHRPAAVSDGGREVLAALIVADAWVDGAPIDQDFLAACGVADRLEDWARRAADELGGPPAITR